MTYYLAYSRTNTTFEKQKRLRNSRFHLRVKQRLPLLKFTVLFPAPTSLSVAYTKHEVSMETTKNRKEFNRHKHAINNVSILIYK